MTSIGCDLDYCISPLDFMGTFFSTVNRVHYLECDCVCVYVRLLHPFINV